ncbi:MAG: SdpI family protein [Candidatus Eisenbacteria bacterium]|uniref:SdpI family protein n=1 Tax=Eiseniibacteriota bacterium TaxID=2212470 RepID=A0A956ND10_UNCEI|nr:SdpI family protein [Candidatus Eisenbacteria bacterium]
MSMSQTFLMMIGVGGFFIVLAFPLIRRQVPPNQWYGLRLAATEDNEWVWYEANVKLGKAMLVLGSAVSLTTIVGPLIPGTTELQYFLATHGVFVVGGFFCLVWTMMKMVATQEEYERRVRNGESVEPVKSDDGADQP